MKKMLLPDINVWLALAFQSHHHHPVAKTWFDALPSQPACCFCRLTQQGFLRLLTNASVFGKDAVTLPNAWRMYDFFMNDVRVVFAEEPAGLEMHWRSHTQHQTYSPSVWNDAYLAAFARAAGFQVVSFDKGFAQYSNVTVILLK
jgi:uncharacterized protein